MIDKELERLVVERREAVDQKRRGGVGHDDSEQMRGIDGASQYFAPHNRWERHRNTLELRVSTERVSAFRCGVLRVDAFEIGAQLAKFRTRVRPALFRVLVDYAGELRSKPGAVRNRIDVQRLRQGSSPARNRNIFADARCSGGNQPRCDQHRHAQQSRERYSAMGSSMPSGKHDAPITGWRS
jgi:hypothetical protein